MVSFEEFKKLDLRIAKILSAEDIPGKDKLLKLEIDLGTEKRILVAGIKPFYQKEKLVGKQIVVVANLDPRPIAGLVSNGMLLAVKATDGTFSLLKPKTEAVLGERVSEIDG